MIGCDSDQAMVGNATEKLCINYRCNLVNNCYTLCNSCGIITSLGRFQL